ncbi:MAG: zinc metalloprotease [Saprospiraceae bacterium]|nr:zinc metalloprotease [Saprospiraceae bacterium]
MKKLFLFAFAIALFGACQDSETDFTDPEATLRMADDFTPPGLQGKNCASMGVLDRQIAANPDRFEKLQAIEAHTQRFINAKPGNGNGNGNGGGGNGGGGNGGGGGEEPTPFEGVVTIPVVVHVIYSNSNENISAGQIQSQMDVLNDDFRALNSDVGQVPAEFAGLVADAEINFVLDQVIRVPSNTTSWGTNDAMKFSSNGGSDVVDPANKLNMWVCNIGGGILGYAQFPGGNSATDGVVMSPQYFGTTGYVSAPFDGGRTTTHEVGHWLNLRHIWGDGRCNRDDFVSDTPTSDRPNYGCPAYPVRHCRSNDMSMNYMDYVDDACMYMFSNGQKDRMRALFAAGGARESFVQ